MKLLPEMRDVPFAQRARFDLLFFLQHYFPKSAAVTHMRNQARDRIAQHVRSKGKGKVIQVERLPKIAPQDFRRRYLANGVPVILEGAAAGWQCTTQWSFEEFKRRFGHETIKLVHRKGLTDDDLVLENEYTEEIGFA